MATTAEPGQREGGLPGAAWADLEIGLHRREAEGYAVELRFSRPDSAVDERFSGDGLAVARIDLDRLRALLLDEVGYGRHLTEALFGGEGVRAAFDHARRLASEREQPLRVRLFIGPSAPELHGVRWETLRDPEDDSPLLTSEDLFFSRYLSSGDWRPVRRRPRQQLRALIAIANPTDLDAFGLAPLNADEELARVAEALGDIPAMALVSLNRPVVAGAPAAAPGKVTIQNLIEHARAGHDILYLVCHGTRRGELTLWLEAEDGTAARVPAGELVARLRDLAERPRLVVLAACRGAGDGVADTGALTALGPRLAEAGIPAVVAMHGEISVETVSAFMPVFFREVQRGGQIDRAMAIARAAVRDRPDHWMPVLFMRLRDGRIWYVPGFRDQQQEFEQWPPLLSHIREGVCTPILGPGLNERLLGSSREIAERWAEVYRFPLAPQHRDDLPQVAQYLSVNHDYQFLRSALSAHVRDEILRRYADFLPPTAATGPLAALLEAAGALWRAQDAEQPHQTLARMPFPLYLTTNPDDFMAAALREAGREPRVLLCPWNDAVAADDEDIRLDPRRPVVYHLFGHIQQPDSLVLTEDDYFDYLIGVTTNRDLIPEPIRRAQASSALLFLGFQLDDWDFRVLFRGIMRAEGSGRRQRYRHVAVQIDPDDSRSLDPERARRYLESYFQNAKISIYWGSTDDFLRELAAQWAASERPVPAHA
jgi:hypothetical protein